jgi:hypothetical protein
VLVVRTKRQLPLRTGGRIRIAFAFGLPGLRPARCQILLSRVAEPFRNERDFTLDSSQSTRLQQRFDRTVVAEQNLLVLS